jgi:hypothetical protein
MRNLLRAYALGPSDGVGQDGEPVWGNPRQRGVADWCSGRYRSDVRGAPVAPLGLALIPNRHVYTARANYAVPQIQPTRPPALVGAAFCVLVSVRGSWMIHQEGRC